MGAFREELERTLEFVEDLPTLPAVAFELERVLQDEATGAAEAAIILEEDPSLTANVLRLANSAAFLSSASGTIVTVKTAIVHLGFREVSQLVRTVAIVDAFSGMGKVLDHEQFWKHSFRVALASRTLIEASKTPLPFDSDEAYVAGLLHDVGMLVLDQYFPNIFSEIQTAVDTQGTARVEAERRSLQMDHGHVGACLLRIWGLPDFLIESVAWHHQPDRAPSEAHGLAAAVHVAETTVGGLEPEQPREQPAVAPSEGSWQDLGLSPSDLPGILETVEAQSNSLITCLL